jgi:ubiquitin-protein ligase
MDIINNELEQWEKKSQNIIKIGLVRENIIHANINNYEIKIDCNDYLNKNILNLRYNENKDLEWLSVVNLYCSLKKPSIKKLFKKIEKEFIKNDIINKDNLLDKNKLEIEELKLKDFLLNKLNENNDLTPLLKSEKKNIYGKNTINELLVNQYINVYKKFKNKNIVIDTINDRADNLRIRFYKFKNENLNNQLKKLENHNKVNYIEIFITFNNNLFPIYPPIIKYMKPILKSQKFIYQISSLKMVNSNYWVPTRTLEFIINKLYDILNNHCEINVNKLINTNKIEYDKFEIIFSELFSLYDFSLFKGYDEIDKEKYPKIYSGEKENKNESKYWNSGTGYGHRNQKKWDIDNFIKIQKENDNRKFNILSSIYKIMKENPDYNFYYLVDESLIIKYIITLVEGINIMEISKHKEVYDIVFNILELLIKNKNSNIISLINTKEENNLYFHLTKLNKLITIYKSFNKDDKTYDFILNLYNIINKQTKIIQINNYRRNMKNVLKEINKNNNLNDKYVEKLKDYSFKPFKISTYSKYAYKKDLSKASLTNRKLLKSINKEYMILIDPIINIDSSIFFTFDDESMVCMQALITGPKDTPYDSGCFLFDILIPNNYPNSPPKVLFKNNGGMRFNPNLYNNGKVCLSLLGTWGSGKDEGWIPGLSTIKQVGISIQSLILIEEPYFNEPSFEKDINKPIGIRRSAEYNMSIKLYNMRHTIYETYTNPPEPFRDVILQHFELKKEYILNKCKEWVDYSKVYDEKNDKKYYSKYDSIYKKILSMYKK